MADLVRITVDEREGAQVAAIAGEVDLASIGDKSPETLLVSILDPNRAVEPKYVGYVVETTDGRVLSGVLGGETANSNIQTAVDQSLDADEPDDHIDRHLRDASDQRVDASPDLPHGRRTSPLQLHLRRFMVVRERLVGTEVPDVALAVTGAVLA